MPTLWGSGPHSPGKFFLLSSLYPTPQVVSETGTPDPWTSLGSMTLALSLPLCGGDSFLPTLGSTSPALFLDQPGLWACRGLIGVFGVGKMRPESPLPVQGGPSGGLDPAVGVAPRG